MNQMKSYFIAFLLVITMQVGAQNRVLVFSKTAAFVHGSIKVGKLALLKLGAENNFKVDTSQDASIFTEENLKKSYSSELATNRIKIVCGDGRLGYSPEAPYDVIHVGAAAPQVP